MKKALIHLGLAAGILLVPTAAHATPNYPPTTAATSTTVPPPSGTTPANGPLPFTGGHTTNEEFWGIVAGLGGGAAVVSEALIRRRNRSR